MIIDPDTLDAQSRYRLLIGLDLHVEPREGVCNLAPFCYTMYESSKDHPPEAGEFEKAALTFVPARSSGPPGYGRQR